MREIKFRAWFGEEHKMIPFDELHIELENGEYAVWYSLDGDSIQDGLCVEDFNIMQYTGLKDKNGKEIYEGDIVEAIYSVDGCYDTTEDEYGVIQWCDKKCGFNLFFKSQQESYSISYYVTFIVIGNIYENPELLEKI